MTHLVTLFEPCGVGERADEPIKMASFLLWHLASLSCSVEVIEQNLGKNYISVSFLWVGISRPLLPPFLPEMRLTSALHH